MASFLKRLQTEEKQVPLNVYEPEIVVDGSIVTLKFDMAKVQQIAVEREGERTLQNGTTKTYTKSPAIMLRMNVPDIELEETDEQGQRHLIGATFRLGQAGNGAYATLTPTEDYGIINDPARRAEPVTA